MRMARPAEDSARELLELESAATGGEWQDYLADSGRQYIFTHLADSEASLKLFSALKDSAAIDAGLVCWMRNHAPEIARVYLETLEENRDLLEFLEEINEAETYKRWRNSS